MKGWAKLQNCIYEIKQEYGVDNQHIHKLLRHCLAENLFMEKIDNKDRLKITKILTYK